MRSALSRLAVIFAVIMFHGALPASAASFNCSRATTPDEVAVCSNASLSNLDVKMSTLYGVRMQIPMLMGAKGAARDEQRTWLLQRSTCRADVTCLTAAYEGRIAQLNSEIAAAMQDYCMRIGICG